VTLSRRVPLRRGGPLPRSSLPLRRTGLVSTSALTRKPFVAKPAKRSPEETRARAGLRRRSGGRCEGCPADVATDYAHRTGRAQGGLWCPSNALHLCRRCHSWAHSEPEMARSVGWMVRRSEDPATIPALLHGRGWVLLNPDGSMTSVEGGAT
jgi:hypothetical protein